MYTSVSRRKEYSHKIKIETLEIVPLRIFCGMEISRDRQRRTVSLSMGRYIDKAAEKYKGKYKLSNTPNKG